MSRKRRKSASPIVLAVLALLAQLACRDPSAPMVEPLVARIDQDFFGGITACLQLQLTVTLKRGDEAVTPDSLRWFSSNTEIARVSATGLLTTHAPGGNATIEATAFAGAESARATFAFTVSLSEPPPCPPG
jgi:hypothetical protein